MASSPERKIDDNVVYLLQCIELTPLTPDFRTMGRINGTSTAAEAARYTALKDQIHAAIQEGAIAKAFSGGANVPVDENYIYLFMALDLAEGRVNFKAIAGGLGINQPAARMKFNRLKAAILAALAEDTDSEMEI
ncbi:hypothetical protein N7541_003434 [Penicillium brevicompactum]|uniref:Myb-like DNA-binding domain-containing protein n=1 Tax=Penicillium brevicompactum TaxID=5074 RepID=A0A9W9V127_PENBR|nr:hypothetical protein N7541_003434 [Penicillium brevicompactum]